MYEDKDESIKQFALDNYPELGEIEFKKGKWYKINNENDYLMNYDGESGAYGICEGSWFNELNFNSFHKGKAIPAIDKEVEEALIKEAKKRGFKKGNHKSLVKGCSDEFNGWSFEKSSNRIYTANRYEGGKCIFENGKWATIIENKPPMINDYEMQIEGNIVKFGRKEYTKISIIELYNACGNCDIESVCIDDEHVNVGFEQLKEIVDYLNK